MHEVNMAINCYYYSVVVFLINQVVERFITDTS